MTYSLVFLCGDKQCLGFMSGIHSDFPFSSYTQLCSMGDANDKESGNAFGADRAMYLGAGDGNHL